MTNESNTKANDGIINIVSGLGTSRDKTVHAGYAYTHSLTQQELEAMYRDSWIARRVVDARADDMTREWRRIIFTSKAKSNTEKEMFAVEREELRMCIKAKVNEAMKLARLTGGAAIVIGADDGEKDLAMPLAVDRLKVGGLKWLHVLSGVNINGNADIDADIESKNFRLPKTYSVTAGATHRKIHHSRVIRFVGNYIPYFFASRRNTWGDSVLQNAYSAILAAEVVGKHIEAMLYEATVDVIKGVDFDKAFARENGEAKLKKRFEVAATIKGIHKMLLLDKSEDYAKIQTSFSNLGEVWRQYMIEVCGAARIPFTVLYGQSAAGLNATGDNDIRNYYDACSIAQESDLRPRLEQLDEVLIRSALGYMPSDYRFEFEPLWQLSDKEQAEVDKMRAERDAIYVTEGIIGSDVVGRELIDRGTYSTMTEADISSAKAGREAALP